MVGAYWLVKRNVELMGAGWVIKSVVVIGVTLVGVGWLTRNVVSGVVARTGWVTGSVVVSGVALVVGFWKEIKTW